MKYDAVVIGAGMAGLAATLRLAEEGRKVLCVAKGSGAINLSGGPVDVLGYSPERVFDPRHAVSALIEERSDHPYARVGVQTLAESIEWFKRSAKGTRYVGNLSRNFIVPTALGGTKPSALLPQTMAAGDVTSGGEFALVGFSSYKDFYPQLVAANLAAYDGAAVKTEAIVVDAPLGGEADVGSLALARHFDRLEFRALVAAQVRDCVEGSGPVGFPAVLGLTGGERVWEEMEARLERPVFEIPTLPPSVPGMRLYRTLREAVLARGGRIVVGPELHGADVRDGRVVALHGSVSLRSVTYEADAFVLASGGWGSGGLRMASDRVATEPIFGLPVAGAPDPFKLRFAPGYFDEQPLARSGIAVDDRLRPVDEGGDTLLDNLFVAGAMLAGAMPWREKSGDGVSLSSGYKAAAEILEGE